MSIELDEQVAKAFGWTKADVDASIATGKWISPSGNRCDTVPWYSTDWTVAGPLINRIGINLLQNWSDPPEWLAIRPTSHTAPCLQAKGKTPTEAVALLIVEIHQKEGKV